MNDTDQPYFLSTRLYNSLLRETKTHAKNPNRAGAEHLLNPAVIRQALADGSIYGWRNIGPKSIAQIKQWLADQPPAQPTEEYMTSNPTITDIIASLTRRGFITEPNYFNAQEVQTQLDAVIEEIGEVARLLRRHRQARQDLHPTELALETTDVVIAAVCLLARSAGPHAPGFVAAKLTADEVEASRAPRLAAFRSHARSVRTDPRQQELTHGPLRRNHRSLQRSLTRRNRAHPRTLRRNRLHVRLGHTARRHQLRRRRAPLSHCPAAAREG